MRFGVAQARSCVLGWRRPSRPAIKLPVKERGFSPRGTSADKSAHSDCLNRSAESAAPPKADSLARVGGWPARASIQTEAAPLVAVFDEWVPRTTVSGAWLTATSVFRGLRAAAMANEPELEVSGTHLSKTATGGAASSVVVAQGASPRELNLSGGSSQTQATQQAFFGRCSSGPRCKIPR